MQQHGFSCALNSCSELFSLAPKPYKYFTANLGCLVFTGVVESRYCLLPETSQSPLSISIAVSWELLGANDSIVLRGGSSAAVFSIQTLSYQNSFTLGP